MRHRTAALAVATYLVLLLAFWFTADYFQIAGKLGPRPWPIALSFALLVAPYWFFGFNLAAPLREMLAAPVVRAAGVLAMLVPYLVSSVPRGEFNTGVCLGLAASALAIAALLEFGKGVWADVLVLGLLIWIVEKHLLDTAWPVPGLSGMVKLFLVDVAMYGYLVIRREPKLGFDFRARLSDLSVGLREFAFYAPIAMLLGFAIGFIQWHPGAGSFAQTAASWIFTLFFIAIPEEIFFRGILLQLLEKYTNTRLALFVSAALFGIAHFNKRANVFNWRYVILAAIAGIFYGRAYLAQRRILSAGITHATVDTVWSIWFR